MVRFLGKLFAPVVLVCLVAIVPAGAAGGSYSFTARFALCKEVPIARFQIRKCRT